MLNFPKSTHQLHKFASRDSLYVVDIDARQVLEINSLIWDILECCNQCANDEIIEQLAPKYNSQDILQAFEILAFQEKQGLIFHSDATLLRASTQQQRLRIFVPMSNPFPDDVTYTAGGAVIATHHIIKSLAQYADIFLLSDQKEIAGGIYGISLSNEDWSALPRFLMRERYDGILLLRPDSYHLSRFLIDSQIPVVMRLGTLRGRGGELVNLIFFLYALMRGFDAFLCAAHSVKDFYSQFLFDTDCFRVIPNGVDTELFKPLDKIKAKTEIAHLLGVPEIKTQKVVGFFSRFQLEKGAVIFVKLAEMHPDVLFLVVAPTTQFCSTRNFPPNLIYAGQPPREQIPLFINAFDVYCQPSMVGEEVFGNTVLEVMSCGVPPVVPCFAGFAELVGDAAVLVEAEHFSREIGSFASYCSPECLARGLTQLLDDDDKRGEFSKRARKRALQYRWNLTAQQIIALFVELKQKQKLTGRSNFPVRFVPHYNFAEGKLEHQSVLVSTTADELEYSLMLPAYPQSLIDGVALSLLKTHTFHEVEFVLKHICQDPQTAKDILFRIQGFVDATT